MRAGARSLALSVRVLLFSEKNRDHIGIHIREDLERALAVPAPRFLLHRVALLVARPPQQPCRLALPCRNRGARHLLPKPLIVYSLFFDSYHRSSRPHTLEIGCTHHAAKTAVGPSGDDAPLCLQCVLPSRVLARPAKHPPAILLLPPAIRPAGGSCPTSPVVERTGMRHRTVKGGYGEPL